MKLIEKLQILLSKASPKMRKRLLLLSALLVFGNISIWIITFTLSFFHPVILGLVILAYGLGLRHAVDADHIAAIDNTTRKLMQNGEKPLAVGFFFSLGHATVVVLLCVLVSISAAFVKNNLPFFQETGSFIGTSVSSIFLLFIGIINLFALIDIFKKWKLVKKKKKNPKEIHDQIYLSGLLTKLFKPILKTVTKSQNMYFVGLLFGLGFDTASEVALLSLSATTGAAGISILEILLLPLAFTAGMALIDTLDGILMLGAYGWAYIHPVRKLYYNLQITFISVVVALFIAGIEILQLLTEKLKLHGPIFYAVKTLNLGNLGYIIISTFIISWFVSIFIYKVKKYDLLDIQK